MEFDSNKVLDLNLNLSKATDFNKILEDSGKLTVKEMIEQLNFLLDENLISEDDYLIVLGTGDKTSGYLKLGVCMPHIQIEETNGGFFGLGFSKE